MTIQFPATDLIAGPSAANPPVFLAALVVLISLSGPYLFAMAGIPNLLLGIASGALAIAGIVTALAAAAAQKRYHADKQPRPRARITPDGVTFLPTPASNNAQVFALEHIAAVQLMRRALIVDTHQHHPKPGRHRLVFGPPYVTPHETLAQAVAALNARVKQIHDSQPANN
ncbi:MAG: hypothetical protein P4L54_02275 [Acidocella sp.]|nr:hypothetical protein [Acidocella sp.]